MTTRTEQRIFLAWAVLTLLLGISAVFASSGRSTGLVRPADDASKLTCGIATDRGERVVRLLCAGGVIVQLDADREIDALNQADGTESDACSTPVESTG